eukprot:4058118-Pyramimonas_sp.AAC.1
MLRVACKRAGKPAQRAKQWLTWVAQSPQHTFMRALLADAADESMLAMRSFDTETFDVSAIASHIHVFLVRICELFGPARKALAPPGAGGP